MKAIIRDPPPQPPYPTTPLPDISRGHPALAQQGQGISLLPESAAQGQAGVSCRGIDGPQMNREMGLITRAEQVLSPAALAFVEYFGRLV